jgi:hypothetical protein
MFFTICCVLHNLLQVGKALEHDSDSVASLVDQYATMRSMWQEDRSNLFRLRDMQLDLQKANENRVK